ncbi:MAG: hypothetical protein LBC08_01670, partial [Campylobacteraceae bacterium]|jgi:hypothetical protein|nr:hypothetical protein [Campylobacteraceae bacterium]
MDFQSIFVIYIICELFELFYTQKGDTLSVYITNLLGLYERGIVRFLCMHPSFYAAIFAAIYLNNFSFLIAGLIIIKAFDIILKLMLLDRIVKVKPLGIFAQMIERDIPLNFSLKMALTLFYAVIFYINFAA